MSAKALDGEVILPVNHSNVEDIIHQILDNPVRNTPLYLGGIVNDNLAVLSQRLERIAAEYKEKRTNPAKLLTQQDEQAYQIKMLDVLEEGRDMVLSTAQIGQAVLIALQSHDFGLDDSSALRLHNIIQDTVSRCAEPLDNINMRQQEILARGLVRPFYRPVAKGPKFG